MAKTTSEHAAAARQLLEALEPITGDAGGDAETRAIAAVAHAVLALAGEVAAARGVRDRSDPSTY